MTATIDDRRQQDTRIASAHIESANALRTVEFVSGQRCNVDVHFIHIERDLADCLHRIRMKQDASLTGDFADCFDVLNHADFIVGGHDRNEDRFVRNRFPQIIQINKPSIVDREESNSKSFLFKMLTGVEDGLVLGDRRNDVVALLAIHPGDALDCQIVGFGCAAGDYNLSRISADQCSDLLPSLFHGFFRFPTEFVVAACGIPELVRQVRHHRFEHTRVERGRRVIVHINRQLNHFGFPLLNRF